MWIRLTPKPPSELTAISTSLSTGIETVRAALQAARLEVQAFSTSLLNRELEAVSAVSAATNALIDAISQALDTLLDSSGVYFLFVPIPKKGLARFAVPPSETGASALVSYPVRSLIDGASSEIQTRLQGSKLLEQLFSPGDLLSGGNLHFVNTVMDAVFDEEDTNRPIFTNDSHWAYSALIAGASDISAMIQAGSIIERLFNTPPSANAVSPTRDVGNIVPQNVQVTANGRGVPVVSWDLVPVSRVLSSYDQSTVRATKYAIIRSTDFKARSARRVRDLFPSGDIRQGATGRYGSKVLAVKNYDGIVTRYVDDSPLVEGQTYYYHVAFATRLEPPLRFFGVNPATGDQQTAAVDFGFDLLSGGQPFTKPTQTQNWGAAHTGRPPDWNRSASLATLIPGLNGFIGQLQQYLKSLRSVSQNITTQNNDLIDIIQRKIDKAAAISAEFNDRINQINSIFSGPQAGIYVTIRSGSGGTSDFLADLIDAFESNEENAPPFTNGDEFTTGVIILAVGPDPSSIQAALAAMQTLFAPAATNPALEGINAANGILDELEQQLIKEITGGTNNQPTPSVTFNENMTPRPPGQGDSSCD
jgi:hypothetical protein